MRIQIVVNESLQNPRSQLSFSQTQNHHTMAQKFFFFINADDIQFYIGTNSTTLATQIDSLESFILRVNNWLLQNGLHFNPSESEETAFHNTRSTTFVITSVLCFHYHICTLQGNFNGNSIVE